MATITAPRVFIFVFVLVFAGLFANAALPFSLSVLSGLPAVHLGDKNLPRLKVEIQGLELTLDGHELRWLAFTAPGCCRMRHDHEVPTGPNTRRGSPEYLGSTLR